MSRTRTLPTVFTVALAGFAAFRVGIEQRQEDLAVEPTDGEAWYVGMVTVSPLRQANGIGRTMLEAAENHARERGGKTMEMTVISVRDTLIAWYQRRGYRLTGETEPFPYGDDRFGEPQRDDLVFVVMEKAL